MKQTFDRQAELRASLLPSLTMKGAADNPFAR
jgi:hypothetical protein